MRREKLIKFLIGFSLIFFLTISIYLDSNYSLTITNFSVDSSIKIASPDGSTFIRAVPSGSSVLDPVDCWEEWNNEVVRQVAETLWFYDWTDPNLPRINMLATDETWENSTALRVTLRTGVKFHDGTLFNADAAKWNLDRLLRLCGHTPGSEETRRATPHSLYEDPAGNPLINRTEVTGPFEIIIHLNVPFTPLMDLLCYISGVMLSPTAHSSDANSFIPLEGSDLVGTGPYKYDTYIPDQETQFSRWDDYWGGPNPINITGGLTLYDKMIFKVIDDPYTRNYAMLAGEVDYLEGIISDLIDDFRVDPDTIFYESATPSLEVDYLVFNNKEINVTWRKAMSYAFNYTYVIEEYWQDRVFRSYGLVSPGFGEWYTSDVESIAPYYNKTLARMILSGNDPTPYPVPGIPEAIGRDPLNDADWGLGPNELISFNYSYNTDNIWRSDLYVLLNFWFSDLSIRVLDGGADWAYFLYRAYGYVPGGYDDLQIFWVVWGVDYLDPINVLQPLLSNVSASNSGQVNDPWLENFFKDYLTEFDHAQKVEMIHNISKYLVSILYPHIYGLHDLVQTCHSAELYDVPYDMNRYTFYAYPIKSSFYLYLSRPADITFLVGETGYNIIWNLVGTNLTTPMYYVYKNDDLISNDTWLSGDSVTVNLDGLPHGEYTYKIIIENALKSAEDNVTVNILPRLEISHPPDISYIKGDSGNVISWVVNEGYEGNPNYYIYDESDTLVDSDSWELGVPITFNVDGLSVGTHSFRIEVHNTLEYVEDTVGVEVKEKGIPGFPILIFVFFILIAVASIGIKSKHKLN